MRISDWSSDVCSSDLPSLTPLRRQCITPHLASARARKETMKAKKTPAKKVVKPKAAAKPVAKKSAAAKKPAPSKGGLIKKLTNALKGRSEEHTSELQSLMRISYAVFCLKKKTTITNT